jgi:hypothetical protein
MGPGGMSDLSGITWQAGYKIPGLFFYFAVYFTGCMNFGNRSQVLEATHGSLVAPRDPFFGKKAPHATRCGAFFRFDCADSSGSAKTDTTHHYY